MMGSLLKNPVKGCNRILIFPWQWSAIGMLPYIGTEINKVVPSWVPF